jgi:hypothetical protein
MARNQRIARRIAMEFLRKWRNALSKIRSQPSPHQAQTSRCESSSNQQTSEPPKSPAQPREFPFVNRIVLIKPTTVAQCPIPAQKISSAAQPKVETVTIRRLEVPTSMIRAPKSAFKELQDQCKSLKHELEKMIEILR